MGLASAPPEVPLSHAETVSQELALFHTVAPGLRPGDLRVAALRGQELLGGLYGFELELLTRRADLDAEALLYAPARLGLRQQGAWRWLGGALSALERQAEPDAQGFLRLTAVLEPRLVALRGARRSRALRGLSALDLTRRLLAEVGLLEGPDLRFAPELLEQARRTPPRTRPTLPVHDLLAQERETDLDFLLRHLEREGLTLWFEANEAGAERAVIGERLPWAETPAAPLTRVRELRARLPRAVAVLPAGQPGVEGVGERPVRPGGAPTRTEVDALWQTETQARHLAALRAEELLAREARWIGQAAAPLAPLSRASVPGHPALGVTLSELRLLQAFDAEGECTGAEVECRVEALRADRPFRPARATPWPATADLGAVLAQGALRARPTRAAASPPATMAPGTPATSAPASPAPELALAGAGPLPGPGLGMPEVDADDSVRGDADGLTDNRDLWTKLLAGYELAKSTVDTTALKIPLVSKADLESKFAEIVPRGDTFATFENRASAFEGAYGGGYTVNLGDGAEVSVGDSGSWSEGKQSREVTRFETIYERTTADESESESFVSETTERLEGHWVESTTRLSQYQEETLSVGGRVVSNTNVGGAIVENTNVGGTLTSNTNVGGVVAENLNTPMTAIIENVALNNANSIYGVSSEAVAAGVTQEQKVVGVSMEGTIAGMINSYVIAGFTNEVVVGERCTISGGNAIDINLGPTKLDTFFGAALDVAVGVALGLFGGVKLDIVIGGTGEIVIGENFGMTIGHQFEMGIGGKTEVGLAKNGIGLKKDSKYFNECLGV